MRKLILWLVGAAIALVGLLVAGSWLVSALSRSSESYAEQQARIAREQQSADFWQWVVKAILLLIGIALITFIWQWAANQSHRRKLEEMKTREDLFRLYPDQNGNKPSRFDRQGNTINPRPGNTPYPADYHFVNGAMPTQLQAPGRGGAGSNRGMTIRRNQEAVAYYVNEVTPLELEAPAPARSVNLPDDLQSSTPDLPNLQAEISRKFTDVLPQIETAIREGRGKTETLKELGLAGRYYKDTSPLWDEVEARLKKG